MAKPFFFSIDNISNNLSAKNLSSNNSSSNNLKANNLNSNNLSAKNLKANNNNLSSSNSSSNNLAANKLKANNLSSSNLNSNNLNINLGINQTEPKSDNKKLNIYNNISVANFNSQEIIISVLKGESEWALAKQDRLIYSYNRSIALDILDINNNLDIINIPDAQEIKKDNLESFILNPHECLILKKDTKYRIRAAEEAVILLIG